MLSERFHISPPIHALVDLAAPSVALSVAIATGLYREPFRYQWLTLAVCTLAAVLVPLGLRGGQPSWHTMRALIRWWAWGALAGLLLFR